MVLHIDVVSVIVFVRTLCNLELLINRLVLMAENIRLWLGNGQTSLGGDSYWMLE